MSHNSIIIASSRLRGDTTSFITTWETTTPDESITIPTTGGGYNYRVDWGDGTVTTGHTGDATHIYAVAGTYTVKISGDFPRIYFNNTGDRLKIKSIEQWGNIVWVNFENSFQGCSNLSGNAIDTPNLSLVTRARFAFDGCNFYNGNVENWNVSTVTNMLSMFRNAAIDRNLANWDISNVTSMNNMFSGVTMSTANYDATLNGWAAQAPNIQSGVVFSGGNSKRSSASLAAYNTLVTTYDWTIVDGGLI